jgi:hypothetical protein
MPPPSLHYHYEYEPRGVKVALLPGTIVAGTARPVENNCVP